jgi:hypothetical protein
MTLFDTFGDSRATIATAHRENALPDVTSSMLPKLHSGALAYERFAKSITGGIFGRQCSA